MFVSAERAVIAALAVLVLALCYATFTPKPAPVAQPSVPSQIPPPCDGRCNPARVTRPFKVVCPYCRNTLTVEPSASTGQAVGTLVPKAAAK